MKVRNALKKDKAIPTVLSQIHVTDYEKNGKNQSKVHMVMKMVAITNGRCPSGQITLLDSSSITICNISYPICLDI